MQKFIPAVMPKTWNSGRTSSARSRPGHQDGHVAGDLCDIHGEIGMGQHGAFGNAGRSAGILQHGEIGAGIDLDRPHRASLGDQLGEAECAGIVWNLGKLGRFEETE